VEYLSLYTEAGDRSVPNHRAACWESVEVQRTRFTVLLEALPRTILEDATILDAGCSRGDLAQFLIDARVPFARYVGIDAIPEVIAFASKRPLPRCEFYRGDFVRDAKVAATAKPDVTFLSGTVNTMTQDQALAVLDALWKASRRALVFNFLSDRASEEAALQTDPIRRLPTVELIEWAFERTPLVSFRQDYLPHGHDATISLVRPPT
jgi:SAM-dependent methyltransferase